MVQLVVWHWLECPHSLFVFQIVISTGRSDWPHTVSSEYDSLASFVDPLLSTAVKPPLPPDYVPTRKIPGIYDPMLSSKITVLNGSHQTVSEDHNTETVLVFPDYKVVTEVERSAEGALHLWQAAVDPTVARRGEVVKGSKIRSWVLPYSCVIMICTSHLVFVHLCWVVC